MDWVLFVTQMLNGLQLGVLLFLLASGLTLIFGIMDFVNLAHGSLYMIGAYFCGTFTDITDSFLYGIILAIPATAVVGVIVEIIIIRNFFFFFECNTTRSHLGTRTRTFVSYNIIYQCYPSSKFDSSRFAIVCALRGAQE